MRVLFPDIKPYAIQRLAVDDLHTLQVEECGIPDGLPVLFLHGGPGAGCEPMHRRFFDPLRYRIVLFDQRGCGQSTPHAELHDNDTWRLVADIEKLIKKKIELEPFAFPENEPHGRFNQGRRLYEHEDGRPPRARDEQRHGGGSRRPAAAPRDPFFDQPYEAAPAGDAAAPSWEASARGGARSPVSANIKPKRKLAALFKPEAPSAS